MLQIEYKFKKNPENDTYNFWLVDNIQEKHTMLTGLDSEKADYLLKLLRNETWSGVRCVIAAIEHDVDANFVRVEGLEPRVRNMRDIQKEFEERHPIVPMHVEVSIQKCIEDYFEIKHVNFKDRTTVVVWEDGSITKVTCQEGDVFSKEVGIAMCIAKRAYGGNSRFNDCITDAIVKQEKAERKKREKELKCGKKKAQKIIEKAKTVGVDTGIQLSDAWAYMKNKRIRNYISISFCAINNSFDRAIVKDYATSYEYEIFDYPDAMWIKSAIDDKEYETVRKWLCDHFSTPEVRVNSLTEIPKLEVIE